MPNESEPQPRDRFMFRKDDTIKQVQIRNDSNDSVFCAIKNDSLFFAVSAASKEASHKIELFVTSSAKGGTEMCLTVQVNFGCP